MRAVLAIHLPVCLLVVLLVGAGCDRKRAILPSGSGGASGSGGRGTGGSGTGGGGGTDACPAEQPSQGASCAGSYTGCGYGRLTCCGQDLGASTVFCTCRNDRVECSYNEFCFF